MAINFPSFSAAQEIFISGQNYLIDNGSKTVTVYYPPSIQTVNGDIIGPGNIGNSVLADGSTTFYHGNSFLSENANPADGIPIQVRETGIIKLLCTYHPKNVNEKFKIEEEIGISLKKESAYLYSKGYMADIQKVLTCDYITVNMPAVSIDPMKFRLIGRPKDKNTIAQNNYFTCWWEQIS